MEPATAIKAGLSLYEAGGLALFLLGIVVIGGHLMFRFLVSMINTQGVRIDKMVGEDRDKMLKSIDTNTASNIAVVNSCSLMSHDVKILTNVLIERVPRVNDSAGFPTPLPGKNH